MWWRVKELGFHIFANLERLFFGYQQNGGFAMSEYGSLFITQHCSSIQLCSSVVVWLG